MRTLLRLLNDFHQDESGHAIPALLSLAAGVGGVLLGIGAGGGGDALAIIGGVVLGLGVLGAGVAEHMTVDYDVYARLEKLEGKKVGD
jgi:hypothetical protein